MVPGTDQVNSLGSGGLSLVFTLLWIVGVINAMNLIDGHDGLAVARVCSVL
jgi:UDP-N-acetylmuramyl pentapeptide phosphotransferase/UDP-N-acetylglucosamine-1-phosphate transferase